MSDYEDGWFKVSRRIFDSSRWFSEDPATVKLMIFVIGEAQNPLNPEPGTVRISDRGLAARTGLDLEVVTEAIGRLSADDPDSRSTPDTGGHRATLERVPGGVRLLNYEPYHPGEMQSAVVKASVRHDRAKKAADARWEKARRANAQE